MNKKNAEEKVKGRRLALIDAEIRSGRYPNTEELASKLGFTPRTIARDIESLKIDYDAPIDYDHKERGYFYTEPNFFIGSVFLSKEELETIILFDQFTKINTREDDDYSVKFRKIIDKLLIDLPEKQTDSLPFSPTPGQHDFIFGGTVQIDGEINHLISTAIRNKEVIEIEHWISDNRKYVKQEIEPLYIFFQRRHYYLLAWKNDNHEPPGVYSINRIKKVNNTGKRFDIPADFKVSKYIKREADISPADNKLYLFEFSFPKEIASEVIDKTYYHNQHIKQCEDGSVYLKFKSTQLYGVFYWVLSQGHKVKVLNPPELVSMIKKEALKVVQYYK